MTDIIPEPNQVAHQGDFVGDANNAWFVMATLAKAIAMISGVTTSDKAAAIAAIEALLSSGSFTRFPLATLLGASNGIATLDANGQVPVGQLPISAFNAFLIGTGVPASGLGYNGDAYYNISNGRIYVKAAGAWSLNNVVDMSLLATTASLAGSQPAAGYPLVNGTGTILSWTSPNDGAMHRVMVIGELLVTVGAPSVGGAISLNYTDPAGAAVTLSNVWSGGQTAQAAPFGPTGQSRILVAPNSTTTLVQGTALSTGTATLWAELWGS
jgi:hypothetical protein